MHVAEAGDREAEPLVMLHGWPQHWWVWRKLIGPLSERYRVICPDLRGFGWSDAPRGRYLKSELADDVVALTDALGLDGFRLAGHDWGGYTGFHVCLKQPDRVTHYAAAGISHLWVRPDEAGLRERLSLIARLWYMFLIASPLLGRQVVRRLPSFMRRVLTEGTANPDAFTEADLETFVRQWSEPDRARASVSIYRSFLTRELTPLAKGAYRDQVLRQPGIVLIGDQDPVLDAEPLRGAEQNLPGFEIRELSGVGHFVPEEAPGEMLTAMLELFER
jgi:pimeloyl-ACP methyl ester carboxylesterase